MSILEKIDSPQDLRRLNKAQLTLLAEEIRALLIPKRIRNAEAIWLPIWA